MAVLADQGLYTVVEAARLLHERPATVRRWAFGYERRGKSYPPVIKTTLPEIDNQRALTFLELVELMFVRGFLKSGANWRLVKDAALFAARTYRTDHPFAMRKWFADPNGIYALLEERGGGETLVQAAGHGQVAMRAALALYLDQLDFNVDQIATRWFPVGKATPVVVDPRRAFGAPVVEGTAIQTATLAAQAAAGQSVEEIAWWYEIEVHRVDAALRFENQLARAA
jgi:uncharacterized protein (DUF433 family)